MADYLKRLAELGLFGPIWVFLKVAKLVPFRQRSRFGGAFVRGATQIIASPRKRIEGNLARVFPQMDDKSRTQLRVQNSYCMGRTLTEILFNEDHVQFHVPHLVEGPGLAAIEQASQDGKGAVIVSGHFGQWDAPRLVLKERGLETGAIYRPNNNRYYEPYFLKGISAAGQPIFPKGPEGLKAMIRHLRGGGRVAILADQFLEEGATLPLLGQPSKTTLSPAQMALRHKVPLVPVWGIREDDTPAVRVIFEDPIPHSTPEEMMTEFNRRLEARVRAHPEQWHWAHKRWKLRGTHHKG